MTTIEEQVEVIDRLTNNYYVTLGIIVTVVIAILGIQLFDRYNFKNKMNQKIEENNKKVSERLQEEYDEKLKYSLQYMDERNSLTIIFSDIQSIQQAMFTYSQLLPVGRFLSFALYYFEQVNSYVKAVNNFEHHTKNELIEFYITANHFFLGEKKIIKNRIDSFLNPKSLFEDDLQELFEKYDRPKNKLSEDDVELIKKINKEIVRFNVLVEESDVDNISSVDIIEIER